MRAPGIGGPSGTGHGCRKSNWGARRAGDVARLSGRVDALTIRREQLEATIGELAPASPWAKDVARLRCLRGIDTLTAVGLCAEVRDFARFERPAQLMSYLGLVPAEHSTGEARRQGHITKPGSSLARSLLIEAAWHYRHPPRLGAKLKGRQQEQPASAVAIAWKAQQRLYQLWRRPDSKRGKRRRLVVVAIARHLTGFCWAIVNTDTSPDPTHTD